MPPQPRRQVRVFISSTFRDMQAERDHLMRVVFPEIEQRCASRGIPFVPVDLRWGVTQEEAESGETLQICLDEIESCRPFFICLLGERYGWTPLPPVVDETAAQRLKPDAAELLQQAYRPNEGYEEFILRSEQERDAQWGPIRGGLEHRLLAALRDAGVPSAGQSITAQEIYHGVLSDPDQEMHSLFYFRDPALTERLSGENREQFYESMDAGRKRLQALKQDIVGMGLQPQTYGDIEQLGRLVLEQLWGRITDEFPDERPEPSDSVSEERRAQELFVDRLTRFFVGRGELLAELDGVVAAGDGYVAVTGPSGCGKTALLANWLYRDGGFIERHPETLVVSHFIGAGARSANAREILSRLCRELAPVAGWHEGIPLDLNELSAALAGILRSAGQRRQVLIVIDALDQLEQSDNAHSLHWLPGTLPEGVAIIASSLSGEQHSTWLPLEARAGNRVLRVPLFGEPAAETMIVKYLDGFRKHLSPEQLVALLEKDDIGSPLYLQVALNELLTFGEYERVTEYIRSLPDTIPAMYSFVLEHVEREHGDAFVGRVMSCLACGRYGMTEHELLALGEAEARAIAPLKWARLHRILSPHLLERGDVLGFYHRQLREAVERRYLPDEDTKRQTHADIAGYFEAQPPTDRRKLEELPWQLAQGGRWAGLEKTLTDLEFLEAKVEQGMVFEVAMDFATANAALPRDRHWAWNLRLLERALRADLSFIARHPETLFQSIWNRAWWYDCPRWAANDGDQSQEACPPPGPKLSELLERWRTGKEARQPGLVWLRSLLPPPTSLEQNQRAVLEPEIVGGSPVFSPCGRFVALGATIWSAHTGAEEHGFPRDSGQILSFSPDGDRVAVWDDAGQLLVRSLHTGAELTRHSTWDPSHHDCLQLAISPDWHFLAVASSRALLVMGFDAPAPRLVRRGRVSSASGRGHSARIGALAFSGNGRRLAFALEAPGETTAVVLDLSGRSEVTRIALEESDWGFPPDTIDAMALSTDGELLAVSTFAFYAYTGAAGLGVYDLLDGTPDWVDERATDTQGHIRDLCFSPDGHLLVAAGPTSVELHSRDGQDCRRLLGHEYCVRQVRVSPDSLIAASTGADHTLRLWDLPGASPDDGDDYPGAALGYAGLHDDMDPGWESADYEIHDLEYSPDGALLAAASGNTLDAHTDILAGTTGTALARLQIWDEKIGVDHCYHNLCFSDDSRWLAISEGLSGVTVRSTERYRAQACAPRGAGAGPPPSVLPISHEEDEHTTHTGFLARVVFSRDAYAFVAGNQVRRVFDAAELAKLEGRFGSLEEDGRLGDALAVSADGVVCATALGRGDVILWSLITGARLALLHGAGPAIRRLCFSPDGRRLAAGLEGVVLLWDTRGDREASRLHGLVGDIVDLAFAPDARRLAASSSQGVSCIWDVTTGECRDAVEGRLACDAVGRHALRALCLGDEFVVQMSDSGAPVAQAPGHVTLLRTHPRGSTWAGARRHTLCSYHLEGCPLNALPSASTEPRVVTAVRRWFGDGGRQGRWAPELTATCPWCARDLPMPHAVLGCLEELGASPAPVPPSLTLPVTAWSDPRLLTACPACHGSVRYNPFAVDMAEAWVAVDHLETPAQPPLGEGAGIPQPSSFSAVVTPQSCLGAVLAGLLSTALIALYLRQLWPGTLLVALWVLSLLLVLLARRRGVVGGVCQSCGGAMVGSLSRGGACRRCHQWLSVVDCPSCRDLFLSPQATTVGKCPHCETLLTCTVPAPASENDTAGNANRAE